MQRFTEYLGEFVAYRRLWAWGLVIAVTIAAGFGLAGFRVFDFQRQSEIPTEELNSLIKSRETFKFGDFRYVVVVEHEDLFQPQRIAALRGLASCFEQETAGGLEQEMPSGSVTWIDKIPKLRGLHVGSLLPAKNAPAEQWQRAKEEVLAHPLAVGQLISGDGKMLLMLVDVPWSANEVRQTVEEACGGSGMRVRVTGTAPLRDAQRVAFHKDHSRIVIIACILVFLLAMIIFRRLSAMLIVGAGPLLGLIWTLGLLELLGQPGNDLLDIILPVMVLMIGFTDGVHLVIHIRQARNQGLEPPEAVHLAVCHVGRACALTSITTAIGFGSLMLSDSSVIYIFGRSSAIGVLITFWAVILVIPLLSGSWLGRRMHTGAQRDLIDSAMQRLLGVADCVVGHARLVAAAGIGLAVLLVFGSLALNPDDRIAYITPHANEAYEAMVDCDRTFGGIQFVQVLIEWPEGAGDDELWEILGQTEQLLADEPLIRGPLSIRHWLSIVPGSPSSKKLSRAKLLPEQFRGMFWNRLSRRALVVAHMQDLGIARYEPTLQRVNDALAELQRQHEGFSFALTGLSIVKGNYVRRFVRDLAWSLALAAGVIFAVLSVAYRSIQVGLISVIPNLLPLAATATIRAAWDTSLDIASACALVICLGIAVDDTIHFLTRFRHEMKSGLDIATSIRRTYATVGNALVMTTVVMMAGFGTVLTSQLPTHRSFAAMGCITLGIALLADLIILPALLLCFFRNGGASEQDRDYDALSEKIRGDQTPYVTPNERR